MEKGESQPMKVFIHTMYYLPEFGSAPILMNELASFLQSNVHEVEVITTIPRPPHHKPYKGQLMHKEKTDGFTVRRFRTNFTVHHIGRLIAWTLYTFWSLWNLRRVNKGDVLFLRLPPLQIGLVGWVARKWAKAGVLISVQDIHPDLSIESGLLRQKWAIQLAQKFEKWIYKQADEIAVISEGFKQNLLDKSVPNSKLHIVPNWVDTDLLRPFPKDNPVSRKFSLYNKFVAMYSGTLTLSSYMTLEKVMEAAKMIKEDENFRLVIVGEGLKKPELEDKARQMNLKNVMFLPFQPYKDLPMLLGASDLLLVPLDEKKTQLSVPSKLYNYMAAGRPIIGFTDDESEVARIISDAECGLNVLPDDVQGMAQIFRALKKQKSQKETMGKRARRCAEQEYAKDVVLKKYEDLLVSLRGIK
ncbi:MAG: glycosyltransferase [Candidatus Aminicenantes bacterium]|nr:glycosyltransferase [Candidatus Aminicenantes bacterium]